MQGLAACAPSPLDRVTRNRARTFRRVVLCTSLQGGDFSAVTTTAVALIATLQGFLLLVVGEVRAGRYGHLVLCEGSGLVPATGA